MRWQHSLFLYFLFATPVLGFAYFYAGRERKKRIQLFGGEIIREKVSRSVHGVKRRFKNFLLLLSVSLLAITLASPQTSSKVKVRKKLGSEFFVALDLSLNMLAEDEPPNRLLRAKKEILELLERLEGYKVGLIVFAGTSFVQCPLTTDYSAIRNFLESVNTQSLPVPGSAFKKVIENARKSFGAEKGTQKYLILFSDGEDLEGEDPTPAAREASREGIAIFCIGFGSSSGSLIPIHEKGVLTGYKKDANGATVVTQLDEKLLSEMAYATRGRYFKSTVDFKEVEDLLEEVARRGKKEITEESEHQYESRFQIPLLLAVFLLVVDMSLSEVRKNFEK